MPFEIKNGVQIERVVYGELEHVSETPSGERVILKSQTYAGFTVLDGKDRKQLLEIQPGGSFDLYGSRSATSLTAIQIEERLLEIKILQRGLLGNVGF